MAYHRYSYEKVGELAKTIFEKYGFSSEDAAIITDVLLTSDRMGIESHGVQRLALYPYGIDIGRIKVNAPIEVVKQTPVSAVVDANESMGQLSSVFAMNLAIQKAKQSGIGMVVVRNSNHYGIAGYYTLMAAKKGLLGISMTNTEALVVPIFGKQPMMGTNPIAVSMPAHPTPFHLDMSTSVVTAGKMEIYAKNKEPVPEGWSVGVDGGVNTRAEEFVRIRKDKLDGGLLPLGGISQLHGGHKGYGLSMVVELMTGILAQGFVSPDVRRVANVERCCHMFCAIDYGMFAEDKAALEASFSKYLQDIRDSKKADGQERIYIHGEPEFEKEQDVLKNGIPINRASYDEIQKVCEKFDIDITDYLGDVVPD